MAITTENLSFLRQGPTLTGQSLQPSQLGMLEVALLGIATFTGDGSASTATLNYIDGTQALNFTPSAIIAVRIGGTEPTTTLVTKCVDAGNSNKTATITFNAAPTSTDTVIVAFFICQ